MILKPLTFLCTSEELQELFVLDGCDDKDSGPADVR